MKNINLIGFILLSCIISSCSIGIDTIQTKGVYDICLDSTSISKEIKFTSLFQQNKSSFFLLDTTANALLGEISKMAICNDKILICDKQTRKQVLAFDKNGHFLYPIGQVGQAPGEYTKITDFTYSETDDLVFILDSRIKKIMVYQLSTGLFIYSIGYNHEFYHIRFFNGKLYTDHPTLFKNQKSKHLLVQIDINNGDIVHSYIEPEKYNQGFDGPLNYGEGPFLPSSIDQFQYSLIFANTIFTTDNEKILPYLTLTSSQWICEKDLDGINLTNDPQVMFNIAQKDKYFGINKYIETKNYIFCSIIKGDKYYYLYYEKANGNIIFTPLLKEDIFFNDTNSEYLRLSYGGSDNKGAYFYLFPSSFKRFSAEEDPYKDSKFEDIKKLEENFNGAVFYYEFKK